MGINPQLHIAIRHAFSEFIDREGGDFKAFKGARIGSLSVELPEGATEGHIQTRIGSGASEREVRLPFSIDEIEEGRGSQKRKRKIIRFKA